MTYDWKRTRLEKFFLYLYFAMLPLYLFPSGMPQISDYMILIWSAVSIFSFSSFIGRRSSVGIYLVFSFIFYILLVSVVWAIYLSDLEPAFFSLFYVFNFFVFVAFMAAFSFDVNGYGWLFIKAVALSLTICLVLLLLNFDPSSARQKAAFNNPNQLAYYALGCLALSALMWKKINVQAGLLMFYIIFTASLLVLSSFSLTATGSLAFLFIGIAVNYGIGIKKIAIFSTFFMVFLLVSSFVVQSEFGGYLHDSWGTRISTIERKTENVGDERGYSRIFDYPEYVILGAAEGARYRFGPENRHEIHSSIGTVLFSYGLPGLILFTLILAISFSRVTLGGKLILLSLLMYALTHQGLRSSLFWACIAIAVLIQTQRSPRDSDSNCQGD